MQTVIVVVVVVVVVIAWQWNALFPCVSTRHELSIIWVIILPINIISAKKNERVGLCTLGFTFEKTSQFLTYELNISWAFGHSYFFATRASQEVSQISLFDLNEYKIKFLTKLTGSMKYIWVNLCGLICLRQVVN